VLTAVQVGKYHMEKDIECKVFTRRKMTINDSEQYEGNIRLNEYLHFAQILYLAYYSKPLFMEDLYAAKESVIVMSVYEMYTGVKFEKSAGFFDLNKQKKHFLDCIYNYFEPKTLDEILELSHRDIEWREKSAMLTRFRPMNPVIAMADYRQTYVDVIRELHI
jgi:hypothetical protein